jgi:dTDP-4-dehydrorhamnose reductase
MRILILGASGMAGHVMTRWLREKHPEWELCTHVYRTKVDPESIVLDLYEFRGKSLGFMVDAVEPDVVINCVGLLIAAAKEDPAKAVYLNSFLPHYLSSKCRTIHISTDCVFSGKDGFRWHTEMARKTEAGIYGITKSAGELLNVRDLTIRTSIVGPELKENGTGLFEWFMKQDGEIQGWTNAFWNGVTTLELAKFTCQVLERESRDPDLGKLSGLCHLYTSELTSKYDLLNVFKNQYSRGVSILENALDSAIDKTMTSVREDILSWYEPKTIENLVQEQHDWYQEEKS